MPVAVDVLMKGGYETLDFSRDGRVRLERYTIDELLNIAGLMRSKKPFQHLLKPCKLRKQREETKTTNRPVSPEVSDRPQPSSMASPNNQKSRQVIYSSDDESFSENSENEIENDEEDASVDDEIFRQLFRPIVSAPVQQSSLPQIPQPTSKAVLNGVNEALGNAEDSNESSLCLELSSSSSASATSMSSGSFESRVDDETFNKIFKPVSLTNSSKTENSAVEKVRSPKKTNASFLFASTSVASMGSISPVGVFAGEGPGPSAERNEGSPSVEVTACSTAKSVVELEPKARQNSDKELVSAVDPFASTNLQNYLKIYRDSKVELLRSAVQKQEPMGGSTAEPVDPLRSPSSRMDHLPEKTRTNDDSSVRKSKVSKGREHVFAKPNPAPERPSTSKAPIADIPEPPDSESSSDLIFHTSDARAHRDWNDSIASRVLRRGLLFVKKGGHVSASRYSYDFRSSSLTVNSVVYACSAISSVADEVAREDADRRKELAQRLADGENVIVKQESETNHQNQPVANSGSKRVKKVTHGEVKTPGVNSTSQGTSVVAESPDKLGITRCGRTIKRTSRLSDYLVGTPRYSVKRTPEKRKEKTVKTETPAAIEICPEKSDQSLGAKVEEPPRANSMGSSSRHTVVERQIPEAAGGLARTGDWGSTGSVDPFTSSGEECDPEDQQPSEAKYAPPLPGKVAHEQRQEEQVLENVNGDEQCVNTIAPVMFVADVTGEAPARQVRSGRRKSRRASEEASSLSNNNNNSKSRYVTKVKQEPGLTSGETRFEAQTNCSVFLQPNPVAEYREPDDASNSSHHQQRNLVIHPFLGITSSKEVAAIKELHDLLYDEPRTVTVEQLMEDLRKSFCIELRSHEQLLRWKKFLTMRNMEMRARLNNMKRLQRTAVPQRRERRRKLNNRDSKSAVAKQPQSTESPLRPEPSAGDGTPSMKLTIKKCASKGRIVYITPHDFGDASPSEASPPAEGSPPATQMDPSVVPIPPPSLFVHPIAAPETQVVPISPIMPAGQTLRVSPPLPVATSSWRLSNPTHGRSAVARPRTGTTPVQRPIILKPIGGKLAGSPPRIIRRLIPINRTPGGMPVVTPLSIPSIVASSSPQIAPAPLYRKIAVSRGNITQTKPDKGIDGEQVKAFPQTNLPDEAVQIVGEIATEIADPEITPVPSDGSAASCTGTGTPRTSSSGQLRIPQRRKRKASGRLR